MVEQDLLASDAVPGPSRTHPATFRSNMRFFAYHFRSAYIHFVRALRGARCIVSDNSQEQRL